MVLCSQCIAQAPLRGLQCKHSLRKARGAHLLGTAPEAPSEPVLSARLPPASALLRPRFRGPGEAFPVHALNPATSAQHPISTPWCRGQHAFSRGYPRHS